MRLLRCHIDNFGKFTDYTVDFTENPTVFCESNGWGKSTLAAFIKVMFYGFSGENKRGATLEKERIRYRPWQGGVYGGELQFEVGGRQYLLNRTFGSREAEDTFALYDAVTNRVSEDYTIHIGEEMFQINQESFLKTVFWGQNASDTSTTDSINAKIGNLADSLDDINNYEKVQQRLKDLRNGMSPTRKTGSLKKQKEAIAELKDELRRMNAMEAAVCELEEKCRETEEEKKRLETERSKTRKLWEKAAMQSAIEAKKTHYDSIVSRSREKQQMMQDALVAVGGSMPDSAQLEKMQDIYKILQEKEFEAEANVLSDVQRAKLLELRQCFEVMSENENGEDGEKRRELEIRLNNGLGEIGRYIDLKTGLDAKKTTLHSLQIMEMQQAVRDEQYRQQKMQQIRKNQLKYVRGKRASLPVMIIGILLTVAGVICLSGSDTIPGVLLLVSGLVAAVSGCTLRMISSRRQAGLEIETDDMDTGSGQSATEKLAQEIVADEMEMRKIKETVEKSLFFLTREECMLFEVPSRLRDKLYEWKDALKEFNLFCVKEKRWTEAEKEAEKCRQKLRQFLVCHGQDERELYDGLQRLQAYKNSYENDSRELARLQAELEAFDGETDWKNLKPSAGEESFSEESLKKRMVQLEEGISCMVEQVNGYRRQLEDRQAELELLSVKKEQLLAAEEEYKAQTVYYERLGCVSDYLEKAKDSLSAKYIGPVLEAFKHYYALLAGEDGENFYMDTDIHVTCRAMGEQRQPDAFSKGSRDLIYMVLRMALIEAMYQKEKPFLVIDDSFVNLDERHLTTAAKFLGQIAREYQVIYFTCHESRMLTE